MKKQLKIAVITGLFPKISETFILSHIASLLDAGHDVTIFSTGYDKAEDIHPIFKSYNMKDITIYRKNPHIGLIRYLQIPCLLIKHIRHLKKLLSTFSLKFYGQLGLKGYFFYDIESFIINKEFDIIHSHFGANASRVGFARMLGLMKGKHICTFHGHDITDMHELKSHYSYTHLKNDLSAAIVVVNYTKKLFEQRVNHNYPVWINPVSIDTNKIKTKEISKTDTKRNKLKLVTAGRLTDCKGQHETIIACTQLMEKYPNVNIEYHIIGDGENMNNIKNTINKSIYKNHFILYGSRSHDELLSIVSNCDVHILFGRKDKNGVIDAQGTVIQEAQATGTPVIVSDGGGLPEGMIDKKTGLIVKENDISSLMDAIFYFYNNRDELARMSVNARQFIVENYSNKVVYGRLFEIYNNVLVS